jgi:hypothetical protein
MASALQPVEFISKWRAIDLSERAVAHSHFIDLCALLGQDAPYATDSGENYCFERGAVKTTGRPGWADVWKRERFGWEYKKKRRNLNDAFVQLQQYAIALENPPLLVVSDIDRIEVHTNWTNSVGAVYEYLLDDLRDAKVRDQLRCVWTDPDKLRPDKSRAELTEETAAEFAALAQRFRQRGHPPQTVAHFINRLVFCMFAEDAGLLPHRMFKKMLEEARRRPSEFSLMGSDLFRAMQSGGRVGFDHVDWFNGGLFDDDTVIPVEPEDIALMQRVADLKWSEIDTSIFGTLFERGLDPDKRSQLGAHYTDRGKIEQIVEPVITRPLLAEWAQVKRTLEGLGGNKALPHRRGDPKQANLATYCNCGGPVLRIVRNPYDLQLLRGGPYGAVRRFGRLATRDARLCRRSRRRGPVARHLRVGARRHRRRHPRESAVGRPHRAGNGPVGHLALACS